MLLRLDRITGTDLHIFDFDFDCTWAGFFLSADERIYGRFGGKDTQAENRLSLPGLRLAMQAALEEHKKGPAVKTAAKKSTPLLPEQYAAAKQMRKGECIHCHQIWEFRRQDLKTAGTWSKDANWVYPWPENVGISLDKDQQTKVVAVAADSPAARAGLKAGDVLQKVHDVKTASFADVQYGLHRVPANGPVTIDWQRGGQALSAKLELAEGWRKTNITWRPSALYILPALTVYGNDLTAAEKKALGLPDKRLAFRQQQDVHEEARKIGVQAGDVIVGINGEKMEMTRSEFFAHFRQNYFIGEKITLDILRNDKSLSLPVTLK